MIKAYNENDLKDKINSLHEVSVPVIVGDAGTGKSTMMASIAAELGFERFIPKRMTGITEEILTGIPDKIEGSKTFEFFTLGFIDEIKQNPDKKIFLFLDEINRTPERLRPALFSLFEKIIDDVYYPNLTIVSAINIGDDYEVNWDIGGDKALLSRISLIKYRVSNSDAINYMIDNDYHHFAVALCKRMDNLTGYKMTSTDEEVGEYEQTTNFRSWKKLSHLFTKNKAKDLKKASEILHTYGLGIMSNEVYFKATNIISSMIRLEETADVSKIIMEGEIPANLNTFEVLLAIRDYSLNKDNVQVTNQYMANIILLLKQNKEIFINYIQEAIKSKLISKSDTVKKVFPILSIEDKKLLSRILGGE